MYSTLGRCIVFSTCSATSTILELIGSFMLALTAAMRSGGATERTI